MSLQVGDIEIGLAEFAARLEERFAGELTDVALQPPVTVVARLAREKLAEVARRLHDLDETPLDCLNLISSVDNVGSLECVYHLYSFPANLYLELHVEVPRGTPVVDTVSDVWPAADWHEREAWDMMGIRFRGHPDLRRILLKDDWIGHPLRKDYVDDVRNHPYV